VRKAGRENLGIQKKDERRMDTARNMGQDHREKIDEVEDQQDQRE